VSGKSHSKSFVLQEPELTSDGLRKIEEGFGFCELTDTFGFEAEALMAKEVLNWLRH